MQGTSRLYYQNTGIADSLIWGDIDRQRLHIIAFAESDICYLNLNLDMVRLGGLYRKLAKIALSLSMLMLSKIGCVDLDPKDMTWKVLNRHLSYSMHEIVQLGAVPRSKIPNSTYSEASSYLTHWQNRSFHTS